MASRNVLDTKVLTTSASNITSANISPTAGNILVMVALTRVGANHTHTPADGFGGLSWTSYTTIQQTGSDRVRISVHWAVVPSTPGTHTVQVDLSASSVRRVLKVFEFVGYDSAAFVRQVLQGQTGVTSTTPSMTLASAPLTGNDVLGFFGSFLGSGGAANILAGDGGGGGGDAFTQETEDQTAAGSTDVDLFIEARTGSTSQTVNASAMAATNNVGIAIEFKVAGGATTHSAAVAFAGAASAAITASVLRAAGVNFQGAGTFASAAGVVQPASVGFTGAATFAGSASVVHAAGVDFAGAGTFAATATIAHAAAVSFSGAAVFDAAGEIIPPGPQTHSASVAFAGTATFDASLAVIRAAQVSYAAAASFGAQAGIVHAVSISYQGAATFGASAGLALGAAVSFAASATFSALPLSLPVSIVVTLVRDLSPTVTVRDRSPTILVRAR